MQGQTVFYRLSEENVWDIKRMREAVASVYSFDGQTHINFFHGAPVEIGMMCPAEVFRCYSEFEEKYNFKLPKTITFPDPQAMRNFSGYADLRVHLPGNDVLWVPLAKLDDNPVAAPNQVNVGSGLLVLPGIGKFTVVLPPPLI